MYNVATVKNDKWQPLRIAFVAKASEIAASAAEGEISRRCSDSYIEDKFTLTTKYAAITAVCSRKELLEVAR